MIVYGLSRRFGREDVRALEGRAAARLPAAGGGSRTAAGGGSRAATARRSSTAAGGGSLPSAAADGFLVSSERLKLDVE